MTPTTPPFPVGASPRTRPPPRIFTGGVPGLREGAAMRVVGQILLVAVGSALGGLTRWGVGLAAGR